MRKRKRQSMENREKKLINRREREKELINRRKREGADQWRTERKELINGGQIGRS